MLITVKLRLRDKHAAELNRQARAVNFVWNYVNETTRKAWTRDRRWLSNYDMQKLTSGSSKDLQLSSGTIERVCATHAASRSAQKVAGLRWRARKSLGWIPFKKDTVSFDGASVVFRSMDFEPMHLNPRLKVGATISAGSFNADARGRWYVNLPVEVDCADRAPVSRVGIDLGLASLATLSNGQKVQARRFYRNSEAVLATAQRARKEPKRIRNIHAKVANRRRDFLHKASARIAKEYGLIVIGDISSSKIVQTKFAKSTLDAGWSDFKGMLSYKAIMHGGSAIEVNERNSSRTCSGCGAIPVSSPKGMGALRIREWSCDDCGAVHDRDVNAAVNILRVGLDTLAEGAIGGRSASPSRPTGAANPQEIVRRSTRQALQGEQHDD